MKNIYIVLVRRFFNENGTDCAMSINSNGDITIFSSKKKALEFHESLNEKCHKYFNANCNEINVANSGDKIIKTTEISYDNTRIYISTIVKHVY